MFAQQDGSNIRALCRRYGISPQTGYKWLRRARSDPEADLSDRSRRPHVSPRRTAAAVEAQVLAVRKQHPCWGGRKIAHRLRALGLSCVPAPSTITEILRRHDRLDDPDQAPPARFQRFERARPNELWQMDFKGHFAHAGGRCHPLTVLDDNSRFSLCLGACADERTDTVKAWLVKVFQRYGLPEQMIMDNGAPWGYGPREPYTPLTIWLMRLGIAISHSRPYHPQTLGKDERFHRTMKAEVLQGRNFQNLEHCQRAFDQWRDIYNLQRPHEAIEMAVPANRYQPSPHPYPTTLPAIEYGPQDLVRKVQQAGKVHFKGKVLSLPKAFRGYPIAFRPTNQDGLWQAFFQTHRIAEINLRDPVS